MWRLLESEWMKWRRSRMWLVLMTLPVLSILQCCLTVDATSRIPTHFAVVFVALAQELVSWHFAVRDGFLDQIVSQLGEQTSACCLEIGRLFFIFGCVLLDFAVMSHPNELLAAFVCL